MKRIPFSLKMSAKVSFSIIASTSIVMSLLGYAISDINKSLQWWKWAIILGCCFLVLTACVYLIFRSQRLKPYKTRINGVPITMKVGDLFDEEGWKVIPCNEYFDTDVDDIVIAHSTLNGELIDRHIRDIEALKKVIELASGDDSQFKGINDNGRMKYPLGRIIPYGNYLLLAFSHFGNQKNAYLGVGEYEQLLFRMWSELRRVYAAKRISIPLLGTGITSIEGLDNKNHTAILRCILCTFRNSNFRPAQGITIVMTSDAMRQIDMDIIKEEF